MGQNERNFILFDDYGKTTCGIIIPKVEFIQMFLKEKGLEYWPAEKFLFADEKKRLGPYISFCSNDRGLEKYYTEGLFLGNSNLIGVKFFDNPYLEEFGRNVAYEILDTNKNKIEMFVDKSNLLKG